MAFRRANQHHAAPPPLVQQIRWAESGSVNFGPQQEIAEGDIGYFPRGTWYGPQLRDHGTTITIQFGFNGEKQHGSKFWQPYQAEAMVRMKANGRFAGGVYTDIDPETGEERVRDGVHALYEEQYMAATGNKFVVPDEGYATPILLHPAAFHYYQAALGIELKHFGRFFDHAGPQADIRMSMLRISNDGRYLLEAGRAQVVWSFGTGLRIGETTYPELTSSTVRWARKSP